MSFGRQTSLLRVDFQRVIDEKWMGNGLFIVKRAFFSFYSYFNSLLV